MSAPAARMNRPKKRQISQDSPSLHAVDAVDDFDIEASLTVFADMSQQLSRSYQRLENRVDKLQTDLQESARQRVREMTEKRKLSLRFDQIFNVMPSALVTLDGDGCVVHANTAAKSLLGEPLEGEAWIGIIQRCFSPDPTDGHEIALKNGKLVSLATQSLGDEPGQIIVINDLTETRILQQQLSHHQNLSEMGRMTASLAHQIRTPLATALLYADHLTQQKMDAERKLRSARKLKEQILNLQSQINDMLIFSRGGVLIEDSLSVAQLLQQISSRFTDMAVAHGIDFQIKPMAIEVNLQCNQELLLSACSNLIENAFQALQETEVEHPQVVLTAEQAADGLLYIQVIDNGPGIPETALAEVVEPFFTTRSTGTGLGLPVVAAIAEAHGGELQLNNLAGAGLMAEIIVPPAADRSH